VGGRLGGGGIGVNDYNSCCVVPRDDPKILTDDSRPADGRHEAVMSKGKLHHVLHPSTLNMALTEFSPTPRCICYRGSRRSACWSKHCNFICSYIWQLNIVAQASIDRNSRRWFDDILLRRTA
jgi:hypothetical protein